MLDPAVLGVVAALATAASWAVGTYLFKPVSEAMSPAAMTLAKSLCGVVLLGAAVMVTGPSPMAWRTVWLLTASGLLGIALGDILFFRALQALSPLALIVLLVVGQALTTVLAVVFLGETLTAAQVVGIAVLLAGVVAVLKATTTEEGGATQLTGVIFGLLSVSCMAAGGIILKAGLNEGAHTVEATFIRMAAGAVGVVVLGLAAGGLAGWSAPFRDRRLAGRFLPGAVLVTFGAFWLGTVAFKYAGVAVASPLMCTEPVIALAIAAGYYRERVPTLAVIGALVAAVGAVLLAAPEANSWIGRLISRPA